MRAGNSGLAGFLVLALLTAPSCANRDESAKNRAQPAAPANVASIAGLELRLVDNSGSCRLSYAAGNVDLQIPWPCSFHRTQRGAVRTKESGKALIALIESSRPHPQLPGDCLTQIQAIKILDGKVFPSQHKDTVAMCVPFEWDIQMFLGLFDQ